MNTKRLEKLSQRLHEQQVDGILVMRPENRRYISGFTGSSAYILVTPNQAVLLTDFRYDQQAREEAPNFEVIQHGQSVTDALAEQVQRLGIGTLAFESDFLTYASYSNFKEKVPGVEWVPTEGIIEKLRQVKDSHEIDILRTAARIADAAFTHILDFLRPGLTEREVALELEVFMRKNGAQGPSFDTIVASGVRSSLPHGVATDKVIEAGDFVKMDFGAQFQGYCSDITRTVVLGQPSERQREIYQIVQEAQQKALDGLHAGMTGKVADALARDLIEARGYGENFGHSLGHGIGLYIHESPRLSKVSEDVLEPGHVVTVEPGIYVAGFGGVRIEDDVVILEDGIDILTHSTKELLIL